MGRRAALWLVLPFFGLVLACALSAPAQAATVYLKTDADLVSGSWDTAPNLASGMYMVLDDSSVRPWSPGVDDDNAFTTALGPSTAEVSVGNYMLAAGEQAVSVKAWGYLKPGTRALRWELVAGTTVLASHTTTAGAAEGWRGIEFDEQLTQAQLYDLRLRFTALNTGETSTVRVASGYVELTTATAPPAPTITASPASPGNDVSPTWSFTADPSAVSNECRLERGATVVEDWLPCTSPKTYNLPAGDASYRFRVRSIGTGASAGPIASSTYALDTTAPTTPVVTSAPPSFTKDPNASVAFTSEGGSFTSCRLERDGTVVSDWTLCSSPVTYNSLATDGVYTVRLQSTDLAGNQSAVATTSFTLDRVNPPAPSITAGPPANGNNPSVSWSFTAETGATTECRLERDGTVLSDWGACTSPKPYTLTTDGVHTFRVRATDRAGNTGAAASATYTLDRDPPPAPTITSGPSGPTKGTSPTFEFTADALATTTCRLERGATVVSDWGPCTSPRTYSLLLQPDGAYTFRVIATDGAGNASPEAQRSFTLDTSAPAAPVIGSGPTGDSQDAMPAYGFTAEIGASTDCRLDRDGSAVSDWAPCSSPAAYNLTSQPDGAYTFRVRATDAAQNTGPEATRSYTLDRAAPPAPALTADPGADTNDATPTWAFTAETGASTSCRLERGATVISDWSACTSPRTHDLSAQSDGDYTFRVRATDAAGNVGAETAHTTSLDRVAPAAPTITGGPAAATADPTPAFEFTAETGAGTACRLERGGTVVSDWSACASPRTYDLTTQSDGAYTFRVRATDDAQNTGPEATRSFTLDRQAPNQPSIGTRPAAATNDETPTWAWTGDAGSTFNCRMTRGAVIVVDWTVCTSPRTFDLSAQPDGTYTFRVRASDLAGNVSTEANDTFALDRAAPPAPTITSGPTGDSQNAAPSYGFTAEAGASTECRLERGGTAVSDWGACSSPRVYDLSAQSDGDYTFRVRATDAAGNTGTESTRSYTLDRAAPAAPAFTAGPTGDSQDDTPTYAWTAESGSANECRVERGATVVSDWAACTSPRTPNLAAEPDGAYTFRVRATDAAGNTGPDAARTYTLDRTAPVAPVIGSGPAADSTDDSPTYAFTAETGAALACRLERGAAVVEDWTACTSPRTYDVSAEPDGTYTFLVRATDAAGNVGPAASRSHTLDRTVPLSPTLDARPGDDGNDRTPAWAFSTTEPGRSFECRLARGATVLFDWGPCVSPRLFDLSLEPDGTYAFGVRAVNAAGTRSPSTADQYRLDTASPAAPVIANGPAPDSSDETPSWDVSAEPGAALACRLERGATVVADWSPCSTPQGYSLVGEPDGTYTFLTRATDAAGNTSAVASASYTLDRTVPLAPVLDTSPPAAGSDPTPTWSFSGEPGRTFECRVVRAATVVSGWAACTSPHTPDLGSQVDGTYTLEVRAINAAGTRSPVTSDEYELDRVTPAAPVITDGPPADSSDGTPTWAFTGEAAAAFECRVDRGATTVIAWGACTSPETSDLSSQADGGFTFRVRQTDPAGNVSPEASRSYTLDRTVPPVPVIDTRPVSPGSDATPEWTLTVTPDFTLECRLTRGPVEVSAWADCTSPRTYDLSSHPDGTYTLHARQYNAAGTRGPEVTDGYHLDVAAPAPPDITAAPAAVGNGSDPAWSFNGESGAALECRLARGTIEVRPWAPCASPRTFGLAGEPDGAYTFSVRGTDSAGNTGAASTHTYEVDRVPPAPPGIAGAPGPVGRDRRPAWSFTAEAGATFECTLAGAAGAIDEWAVCTSPRGYDLGGQPDGGFGFGVRARDAAGNTSAATSSEYTLDTTPGAVTIEGGPGALGRDRRPAWRFSGEEAASFECRLSLRDVPVADWNPCTSPHGFDLGGRPDGTFAFSLRASDPAGNVGPIGSVTYQLDTTPPEAPTIERRPESPGTDRTPSWRFAGEKDASFSCRVEGAESGAVSDWTLCASPFTADLARAENGRYRFLVRASDIAGNTGEPTTAAYELVPPVRAEDPSTDGGDKGKTGDVPADEPGDAAAPLTAKPPTPKPDEPVPPKRPAPAERKRAPLPDPRLKPTPRSTAPAAAPKAPEKKPESGNFATRAVSDAVNAITQNPDKSVFPLSLLLLVLGFLAIQNRIDRSDPKLALAPTFADPDLEFRPPPGDD